MGPAINFAGNVAILSHFRRVLASAFPFSYTIVAFCQADARRIVHV